MNRTSLALALSAAVLAATVLACSQTSPGAPPAASIPAAVSFKADVAPILAQSCAACHTPMGRGARDAVFINAAGQTDYQQARDQLGRIIDSVESGKMPQGPTPLTPAQIAILVGWQQAGAPNN